MIPNFNKDDWTRDKIIDYIIGDSPLTDEQLLFLDYFDNMKLSLNKLNKELTKIKNIIQGIEK